MFVLCVFVDIGYPVMLKFNIIKCRENCYEAKNQK